MAVRTFSCPVCRLLQTKDIGPPLGPHEIMCANCSNYLRVREVGPGQFDSQVWTGGKDRVGNRLWTHAETMSDRPSRIIE